MAPFLYSLVFTVIYFTVTSAQPKCNPLFGARCLQAVTDTDLDTRTNCRHGEIDCDYADDYLSLDYDRYPSSRDIDYDQGGLTSQGFREMQRKYRIADIIYQIRKSKRNKKPRTFDDSNDDMVTRGNNEALRNYMYGTDVIDPDTIDQSSRGFRELQLEARRKYILHQLKKFRNRRRRT